MRHETIATVCEQILGLTEKDRVVVAIDGVDGSGKSSFARELLATLKEKAVHSTVLAGVDGFHNQRAIRYAKGADSPRGFFEDSYNYRSLEDLLLKPFIAGEKCVQIRCFDHRNDTQVADFAHVESRKAYLIVEGIFLHRKELIRYWDYSVFIHADFHTTFRRMSRRDGCSPDPCDPANRRYYDGQMIYLRDCAPAGKATLIIDNTEFERAFITSADQLPLDHSAD